MNSSKIIAFIIFLVQVLCINTFLQAQTDQEFWFVAPEVNDYHGGGGQPTFLRLATYDLPTTVTITQPANPLFTPIIIPIPANDNRSIEFRKGGGGAGIYDLNLIENVIQAPMPGRPGNVNTVGLKISSTTNITAYYEISSNYNREIIALKGRNAVGREFYVPFQTEFPTYTGYNFLYSAIDIVATQATTVNIRPTVPMLIVDNSGDVVIPAGTTYSINLNTGETFSAFPYGLGENMYHNISRSNRLAGTRVWSADSCLAVQTKDDLVQDNHAVCSGCNGDIDYVADQLVPTDLLGNTYVVMTGQITTVPEFVYVLATENNTTVSLNGTALPPNIGAGEQKTIRIDNLVSNFNLVETDKPALVYHVSGFAGQMGGSILPQIDVCTGSQEVVFTRPKAAPFGFFMNILVRKGAENNFQLNGVPGLINPIGGWTEIVPNEWMAGTINANFVTALVAQTISNSDVFHLGIINGNGSWDCFYGYFSDFNKLDVSATIVGTIDGSQVLCYGESTQLIASKGNSYLWTADATPFYIDNPTSQTPTVSPLSNKKYKVVVEGGCNIKDSAYAEIIVSDPIEASFSLSDALGCAPMNVAIVNHSEDNWAVTNYKWDMNNDGLPEYTTGPDTIWHVFDNNTTNPITYAVKLRTENVLRCKDSLYADVTVYPAIHADFEPDTSGCNPLSVPFANLSYGHTGTYNWLFGDGATSNLVEPIHTYHNHTSNTQTYTTQLIATAPSFFCKDTIRKTVTVEPAMYAQFHLDKNLGCNPLTISPTNLSAPASIDSYKWIWGDGDTTHTQNPGSHTFNNLGGIPETFTIKLITYKGACTDTIVETVTVYPGVSATIDQDINIGCHPLTVNFEDLSTGSVADQKWLFGDGTLANNQTNVAHDFKNFSIADTTFTTQLIISSANGCADTAEVTTTIHPYINAGFTPNYIKGCADLDVSIINQSSGAISNYEWNWGDGSLPETIPAPGTHTYTNPSNLTVTNQLQLVVFNTANCSDTIQQNIEIYPVADATFTANPTTGCNPLEVTLNHTPTNTVPVQLNWNFGDNSFGSLPSITHKYQHQDATTQNFEIELTALTTNGCSDTMRTTINVAPYINIGFDIDSANGCSPLSITLKNNSQGGIDDYTWKKENVVFSTAQSPGTITLLNNSNSVIDTTITLIGVNNISGCLDSIQKTVSIYPSVDANFTAVPDEGCNPLTVNYTHTPLNTPVFSREWTFGDNNSSSIANPQHTFENETALAKTFKTKLVVQSNYNCIDSAEQDIKVASIMQPDFTVSKANGCSPLTIQLEDVTIGEVTTRTWTKSGDVFATNDAAPTLTLYNNSNAPIDTVITLTVQNSGPGICQSSVSKTVTIYPSVDANFTAVPDEGCNPLTVNYTHTPLNTPAFSREWTFGDNNSSSIANPQHTFENETALAKTFITKLIVQSNYNCRDTAEQDIKVASIMQPDFTVSKANGCSPLTIQLEDVTIGEVTTRTWTKSGDVFATNIVAPTLTLYNNSNAPIDTVITLTVQNSGPGICQSSVSKTITIYPSVDANFTAVPDEGCNPLIVDFTHAPTNNPTVSWAWTFGDNNSSSITNPQHIFENETTLAKTFRTKLIVQSNYNCRDTAEQDIQVASIIQPNFTMSKASGCSPLTIRLRDVTIGEITTRTWTKSGVVFATNQASPILTLYNNSNVPIDTTITLTVQNGGPGTCQSSVSKTVTIYPSVDATFIADVDEGCNPLTVNFTHTPISDPVVSYFWDFKDNQTSNIANPNHTFENESSNSISYDVELKVVSVYGCEESANLPITVAPYIDARFNATKTQGCSPMNIRFSDVSEGNITARTWKRDGVTFSNTMNPQLQFINTSNQTRLDTILLIVQNGNSVTCYDSVSRIITVYPEVDATFSSSVTEGCNPLTVDFQHTPSQNIPVNYYWEFSDGALGNFASVSHEFVNELETPQIFDVKLLVKSTNGCKDSVYSEVEVASRLKANFTMPTSSGCSPFTTTFQNISEGDIATIHWYKDNTLFSTSNAPSTSIINNTNANITQNIKLVITNNGPGSCADSITRQITANPKPVANFSIDDNRGCNPHPAQFTYEPGTNTLNVDFDWNFGDNTTSDEQNPPHTFEHFNYNGISNFDVSLTTTTQYGCSTTQTQNVIVERALKAEYTIDPSAGCNPFDASFINTSKGAQTYKWVYGDATPNLNSTTLQNVGHQYTNTSYNDQAVYQAKLVVTNTGGVCSDSMTHAIKVHPLLNASFTVNKLEGCHPINVQLSDQSQGAGLSHYWDFDDLTSSTETNPAHVFRNPSNTNDLYFNVKLNITNEFECEDDTTITIRVNHLPKSQFTINQTADCAPLEIYANNTSIGHSSFEWRLGNGETNQNTPLNYSYYNNGSETQSYKLELHTLTNRNCKDSTSLILNAYPQVNANFEIATDEGCNPLTTAFENLSTNATNYLWEFGDGRTSNLANPTNRFAISGYENQTIPVKLTSSSTYNCTDSISKFVTVYVQPEASFEPDPFIQQFPASTVNIEDWSIDGPFNYLWSFGDGNQSITEQPEPHTYETWGIYTIDLEITNTEFNCFDSASQQITIDPPIVTASFTLSDTSGCMPLTVNFMAQASEFTDDNYTYFWDFGDGNTSNEQSPTYTYEDEGLYPVTLTVIGENGNMNSSKSIRVHPLPEVNFTMEPKLLLIPDDQAQCYNLTQYGETYLWDFGDGETSTDKNPTHYFSREDVYNISLTATSEHGCVATHTKDAYIEVRGKGLLKFPNAFTPSLAGPSDEEYDPNSPKNDIFHPQAEGVTEYTLLIYNRWGELMFKSSKIEIGWDGYYNNKLCPQDVYVWKAKGKFINGKTFEQTGDVTLLR